MKKEIEALNENQTWTLPDLPRDRKAIGFKWIYKIKYLPYGEIKRYNAKLVAKEFTQKEGLDFYEIFTLVKK